MPDKDDLTLAKLEAAAQITSAFAQTMSHPIAYATDDYQAVGDCLATVFKALWKAIEESVGK